MPEIFNGDGCLASTTDPWRLPLRKSALLRIQCQPCVRLGAPSGEPPGFGHLCRVYREDACTLKMMIALECPARQTVFAQSLDVGTSPASPADVVSMGRPQNCAAAASQGAPPAAAARTRAAEPHLFHLSLTHDDIELAAPLFRVEPSGCTARALGRGVTATGGVMHATRPQVLRVACSCADGPRLANVTVTLALLEYTSPVWSYLHMCSGGEEPALAADGETARV